MKRRGDTSRFVITEIFMAKAGWDRCFMGTIQRGFDDDGLPCVFGRIEMPDAYVLGMATHQELLGEKLDEMVLFILDNGLFESFCGVENINGIDIYLN